MWEGGIKCLRAKQNTAGLGGCYVVKYWSINAIEGENNLVPFTTHNLNCI